jgi:hypothetical protein
LLDARHKIVNFGISIPDEENKTGTDKHTAMFRKTKLFTSTLYSHAPCQITRAMNISYILVEWFYFNIDAQGAS